VTFATDSFKAKSDTRFVTLDCGIFPPFDAVEWSCPALVKSPIVGAVRLTPVIKPLLIVGFVRILFVSVWAPVVVTAGTPPCWRVVAFTVPPLIVGEVRVLFVRVCVVVVPTTSAVAPMSCTFEAAAS
jgi:hypothetical protein